MVIPLEVAIGRLTGLLHCQTHQTPLYREAPEAFEVCPHCKRQVIPYWNHGDGYVFPGEWQRPEHGSVTPMKSAVVNTHPYVPDCRAVPDVANRRGSRRMNIDPQPKPTGFVVVRCPQCLCTAILLSYEDEDPDRAYWCPCPAGTQAIVIARAALRETDVALLLLY